MAATTASTPSAASPRVAGTTRPSRRLQWLTVLVGFLFFVLLLAESALLVLAPQSSAVSFAGGAAGAGDQVLILALGAAALVLGGLTLFFAAACAGRYRFLVKVAAILLFLGALVRLAWPMFIEAGYRTGAFARDQIFGRSLFLGPDALLPASLLPYVNWFAMGPALLLTLLGLLGLILIAPKRVLVATDTAPATETVPATGTPSDRAEIDRTDPDRTSSDTRPVNDSRPVDDARPVDSSHPDDPRGR